jgi:hypothetical protein
MPSMGKTLAAGVLMLASALASAESVGWLEKGASGTLVAGGRGADGTTLYVCRAVAADGSPALGQVAMSGERAGECQVAAQGQEQVLGSFDLLVETGGTQGVYRWVPGHATGYPQRSVIAGRSEDGRRWLVCAALHLADGSVHPGSIQDDNCVYAYGGRQQVAENYLVLASNDPEATTTEEAQPAAEGFDPGAILAAGGIARFCALVEGHCARALPEPPAAAAAAN